LGKSATVFQTEIYAILQCACENIGRAYKNKRILIFSDSQAVLRALSSPKVTSGLVAECLDALSAVASLNEVTLIWVPGHCGILGNEEADKQTYFILPFSYSASATDNTNIMVISTFEVERHNTAT
jgi:ribonuclease HI